MDNVAGKELFTSTVGRYELEQYINEIEEVYKLEYFTEEDNDDYDPYMIRMTHRETGEVKVIGAETSLIVILDSYKYFTDTQSQQQEATS